jgi:hypothetical protein
MVVDERGSDKFRRALWSCLCSCGQYKTVATRELVSGAVISCGCLQDSKQFKTDHGFSKTKEYRIWANIRLRCSNKCPQKMRKYYYDRGITMHDEWKGKGGFIKFIEHIGPRPSEDYSVDRIDNNRGYEPGNIRWATRSQQAKNTRKAMAIESFSDDEIVAEAKRRGLL